MIFHSCAAFRYGARRFSFRRTCPAARSDAARYYRAAFETQGAGRCAGVVQSLFYRSGGETVRRTCHRFTDRHGTGTASRTRRDCPADCPARSRQTVRQAVRRERLPQIGNGCRLSGRPSGEIAADRAADRERLRLSPVRQTVRRGVGTVATAGGFRRVVFSGIYKAQAIEKSGKTQTRRNGARRRRLSRPKRQNRP